MIRYKSGYKYQLHETYQIQTKIRPPRYIGTRYIVLTIAGVLTIKRGYAWDGPSGPTYDTKSFMRGSLVHDALYQLMRQHRLSLFERRKADQLLKDICIEDGMWKWYAHLVYKAVRFFGAAEDRCEIPREIFSAP